MDGQQPAAGAEPLHQSLGLVRVISASEEGRAAMEYLATLAMCHSGGVVQGGFVTGWIDNAMAHAAIARSGPGIVPISLEIKVSFLAPVRPGPVIAEGWMLHGGRKTVFFEGQLTDRAGTLLAKATSTMMLADRKRIEAAAAAATGGNA